MLVIQYAKVTATTIMMNILLNPHNTTVINTKTFISTCCLERESIMILLFLQIPRESILITMIAKMWELMISRMMMIMITMRMIMMMMEEGTERIKTMMMMNKKTMVVVLPPTMKI